MVKYVNREYSFDSGYIDLTLSYLDYSKIADRIPVGRIISSTRTTSLLDEYTNDLEVVIPDWILNLREELSTTVNSLTGESYSYLLGLSGNKLINELSCIDRSVSLWSNLINKAYDSYLALIKEDDLDSLEVKDILPLSTALHFTLHINEDYFKDNIWKILTH
jgi:hypothetical protein